MSSPAPVRFSLRNKLFLLIITGIIALVAITVWQIGRQAEHIAFRFIDRSLEQSNIVLDTKLDSRFNSMIEVATSIAKDGRILPLVYELDVQTLQDQSQEFQKALEFDVLIFTDAQGIVLARSDRPEMAGLNVAGRTHYFDQALNGNTATGYMQSQGQLLQIVSVPIFDNVVPNLVRGSVSLAYALGEELAEEINALTASDIGFILFTRDNKGNINGAEAIYNTKPTLTAPINQFFTNTPLAWQNLMLNQNSSRQAMSLADDQYFTASHLLGNNGSQPLGVVMALRASNELLKPFVDLQRTVIIIGVACMVVATLFAWLLARGISNPIVALVSVARKIEDGNFSDLGQGIKTGDEVGVLYGAVLRMGNTLREKAELENYLAQISNELNERANLEQLANAGLINDESATGGGQQTSEPMPTSADAPTVIAEDEEATLLVEPSQTTTPSTRHRNTLGQAQLIDNRYKILKMIGSGAMSDVYLVQDIELDERVALKIIDKEIFKTHTSIDIKEEIKLARRITHRNILRTYDFSSWQEYFYISMEYVQGYDLSELLARKGALDLYIGGLMIRQICSALAAAHDQGIIHLDLKPANMMINRQGILKIMDFGLARTLAAQAVDKSDSANQQIAGTPRYMAPEQFLAQTLDERTDIYAVGIIMATLFCGEPPFSGKTLQELANLHLVKPLPPLIGPNGPLPKPLVDIITKATAKKPEDRYQSIKLMLEEITQLQLPQ